MATNIYTHCGHGKAYGDGCGECDAVWAAEVTLPEARKTVARLLKFYNRESLIDLIFSQDAHIEKLQSKLPATKDDTVRRLREG